MKQILLTTLFMAMAMICHSQTITLDLPANAGLSYALAVKQGVKSDTIYTGSLDEKGKAVFTVPQQYKDFRGMAELKLNRLGSQLDFILASGENPTIVCTEEYPHGGNVEFINSPENESLQEWFMGQATRQQKMGLLDEVKRSYKPEDNFYPALDKELSALNTKQLSFENELKTSELYAAWFVRSHNYMSKEIGGLIFADSVKMAQVRSFVRDSLDINSLYTSGMWYPTINGLLAIYDRDAPYHKEFVNDMSVLLDKCQSEKEYNTLAENLFSICESTGWNDLEEQLAYFLINDGRIKNPTGKLQMLMTLFKLAKGSKAPKLAQYNGELKNTLLVFYESGCGSCENEIEQLKGNYKLLQEKGYRLITISADTDKNIFRNTSATYPWTDKYCDFEGFQSSDFKTFGVVGTPTFFVVDNKGFIGGRYARLADTGLLGIK